MEFYCLFEALQDVVTMNYCTECAVFALSKLYFLYKLSVKSESLHSNTVSLVLLSLMW